MEDDIKALRQQVEGLETLICQLLYCHTPEGQFAAEQACLAYRKRHTPLLGSPIGRSVDSALTRPENPARSAVLMRTRGTAIQNG